MRLLRVIFLAPLFAAALAGCSNDESSKTDPAGPTKSATAAQTGSGEAIPDGTYAKSVTVADAKTAGIVDKGFLSGNFGDDGSTTFTFKFQDDRWTLFVTPGGGAPEPGDLGSITYDEHGDVVLTSESEGCPGCTGVYDWELDGSQLTMSFAEHDSSDRPEALAIERFVTEGTFTRES
jgi:hypothetical protein